MVEQILIGAILTLTTMTIFWIRKEADKAMNGQLELMEELSLVLRRENYLLKTMNDAMNVSDPKGFMAQRMRNAPEGFEPKTDEEVNRDIISG